MAVHIQGGGGGGGRGIERVAVHVQYVYCHSYYGVYGYSDRRVGCTEWQYTYSTCTVTVTMVYTDTLTGGVGGREWQYTYCHSYYGVHGYSDRWGRG